MRAEADARAAVLEAIERLAELPTDEAELPRVLSSLASGCAGSQAALAILNAEREQQLGAFWRVTAPADNEAWWRTLRQVWIYQALPIYALSAWRTIWRQRPASRALVMTDAERRHLAALPEHVQAYRGYVGDTWANGMSWTRGPNIAERYARARHTGGPGIGEPMHVAQATIPKEHILAVLIDRLNVIELVIDPDDIAVTHITDVETPRIGPTAALPVRSISDGEGRRHPSRPVSLSDFCKPAGFSATAPPMADSPHVFGARRGPR